MAEAYLVSLCGVVDALVDVGRRDVVLYPASAAVAEATLSHFFLDQLLPGLLDKGGKLVVHGGGIVTPIGGLLIAGPSGRGKSTLVTALGLAGNRIQNDDSAILEMRDGQAVISPIYSGIRLLPDSLDGLFPPGTPTSQVSHYATKRRVHRNELLTEASAPLAAILFLTGEDSSLLKIEALPPARACMELLNLSMALDPTDLQRAQKRTLQAGAIASEVPAFNLSYPRGLERLPEVCNALLADLGERLETAVQN